MSDDELAALQKTTRKLAQIVTQEARRRRGTRGVGVLAAIRSFLAMSSAGLTMLLSKLANRCSRSSYSKIGNTHGNFVKWDRLTNSARPRSRIGWIGREVKSGTIL
jgi:hypothetical protein